MVELHILEMCQVIEYQSVKLNARLTMIVTVIKGKNLEQRLDLPAEIVEEDIWVTKGTKVDSFEGANNAIGTLVLKFRTQEDLENAITHQRAWLNVIVK